MLSKGSDYSSFILKYEKGKKIFFFLIKEFQISIVVLNLVINIVLKIEVLIF